jgi:transglutaminase-like putative cysteine protease
LAFASAIQPDKPVVNPGSLKRFKFLLNVTGANDIPNDQHQTATKTATGWEINVHPVSATDSAGLTIPEAAKDQPMWVQPDTYIPSDSKRFRDLATRIIGPEKRVRGAAIAVQNWVANRMEPNLGIGVLRDANEVLTSKQGVCRDYAILAATILRAGGVPTRLCSGLVSWDGTFYYHAWVEVWNGKSWIGVDPTVTDPQISAAHIKLADGNIATAFQFPVLDKVSIKVEEAISR